MNGFINEALRSYDDSLKIIKSRKIKKFIPNLLTDIYLLISSSK